MVGAARALEDDTLVVRDWPVERAESASEPVTSSHPITPLKTSIPQVVLSSPAEPDTSSPGMITRSRKRTLPAPDHVVDTVSTEASPSISASRRGSLFEKGKRRQPSITPSATPSKRRRRNPLDGNVLSWPVSIPDFENLERLRQIRSDFERFMKIVDSKIDALESAIVEEDPKEKAYWDQVLLDLESL